MEFRFVGQETASSRHAARRIAHCGHSSRARTMRAHAQTSTHARRRCARGGAACVATNESQEQRARSGRPGDEDAVGELKPLPPRSGGRRLALHARVLSDRSMMRDREANRRALEALRRPAYSGELAAVFAYGGHALGLRSPERGASCARTSLRSIAVWKQPGRARFRLVTLRFVRAWPSRRPRSSHVPRLPAPSHLRHGAVPGGVPPAALDRRGPSARPLCDDDRDDDDRDPAK